MVKKIGVVGGGPAGSLLALLLAKNRSYEVTLYQENGAPRGYCAGGLGIGAINEIYKIQEFGEFFWDEIFKEADAYDIHSVRLEADINGRTEYVRYENPDRRLGIVMDREKFDYALYRRAKEEVDQLYEEHANIAKVAEKHDIVIDARGYSAWRPRDCEHMVFVKQWWVPLVRERDLVISFSNILTEGYYWAFPHYGSTKYGFGELASIYPKKKDAILMMAEQFWKVRPWEQVGKIYAAVLPLCGHKHIRLYRDKTFYVGTAAGLIDPLTGAGIRYALQSAYALARALNRTEKLGLARFLYQTYTYRIRLEIKLLEKVRNDIFVNNRFMHYFHKLAGLIEEVEKNKMDLTKITPWKAMKLVLSL